ncbi:MAG: TonB-dependent receptor [Pseudomonadota bacterium]
MFCGTLLGAAQAPAQETGQAETGAQTSQSATPSDTAVELNRIVVSETLEDPTGPVDGYRAQRSSSGTKLDIPIEELPLSIQVLPRDIIEDSNADRVEDTVLAATGAAVGNTFGAINESFILRGFAADVADNGALSTFGPVRRRDSANVERIEVLSGPAGALFGFGPPGGVINVVTKKPQEGFFAEGRTSASSRVRLRQEFDINTPVSETWNTNARIVGSLEGTDSFRFRQAFDQSFPESRQFVAPSISFEPTDDLSVVFKAQYMRDDVVFDRGVPIDAGGDAVTGIDAFFGDEEFSDFRVRAIIGDLEVGYEINEDWGLSFRGSIDDNKRDGFSLEPEILSPISFPGALLGLPIDVVAGETVLRQLEDRDQGIRRFFGRTDLNGTFRIGPVSHDLLLSVDAQRTRSDSKIAQSGVIDAVSIFEPGTPTPLDASDLGPPLITDTVVETVSFTFFDKISWGERLHILGGGRVDILDQTTESSSAGVIDISTTEFSPRVGLVVRPIDNLPVSAFFSYGQSFEPNTEFSITGAPIEPQIGRTFEGGVRVDFLDGDLGLTVTAFDIALENVPVTTDATFFVGSEQESRGVEVALQGAVTPNFNIVANYTYVDSELSSVDPGGLEPALGEPLAGVPEHAFSVLGSYSFDQGTLDGLTLTAGLRYRGGRLATNSFDVPILGILDAIEFDSFVDIDIGASYVLTEDVELEVGISNLLDQEILRGNTGNIAIPEPGIEGFAALTVRF